MRRAFLFLFLTILIFACNNTENINVPKIEANSELDNIKSYFAFVLGESYEISKQNLNRFDIESNNEYLNVTRASKDNYNFLGRQTEKVTLKYEEGILSKIYFDISYESIPYFVKTFSKKFGNFNTIWNDDCDFRPLLKWVGQDVTLTLREYRGGIEIYLVSSSTNKKVNELRNKRYQELVGQNNK